MASLRLSFLLVLFFFIHCRCQISQVISNTSTLCVFPQMAYKRVKVSSRTVTGNSQNQVEVISARHRWGDFSYYAKISIGTPPTPALLVVDSGSDLSWLQCKESYPQVEPVFKPENSATYAGVLFDSAECQQLEKGSMDPDNKLCMYEVKYADASYSKGKLIMDTLTLKDSAVQNHVIGCGIDNKLYGEYSVNSGVLALSSGPLSFPSQLHASSFSYCFVQIESEDSSVLEIGSPPIPPNSVVSALLRNTRKKNYDSYYYLDLSGIRVGDTRLRYTRYDFAMDKKGSGGFTIDSGTYITRLKHPIYAALRDAFKEKIPELEPFRSYPHDTCYRLKRGECYDFPNIIFYFGKQTLTLEQDNVLVQVQKDDESEIRCLAFSPTLPRSGVMIMGSHQQQRMRITYDLANSLIGFTPNSC